MAANNSDKVSLKMSSRRHYVSGLWLLPDNPKRDASHYESLLPKAFDLFSGSTLCFYTDSDTVIKQISSLAETRDIELNTINSNVTELPAWDFAQAALAACERMHLDQFAPPDDFAREKGAIHYWRDLKGGGADTYRAMVAIWLSKVALTAKVARSHENVSIAWADASIARFNRRRTNWDFTGDSGEVGLISHYDSQMRFFGRTLPLSASYMEGGLQAWNELEQLFNAMLAKALQMPYGHDEETVLGQCVNASPDLFRCIGRVHQNHYREPLWNSRRNWWKRISKKG